MDYVRERYTRNYLALAPMAVPPQQLAHMEMEDLAAIRTAFEKAPASNAHATPEAPTHQ